MILPKKTVSLFEGALLNKTKKISCKMIYYSFHTFMKNTFFSQPQKMHLLSAQAIYYKKSLMLSRNVIFSVKQ